MKLTRPRILLLVLLLALVGVLAVAWRPLWLAVVYEETSLVGISGSRDAPDLVVYEQRFAWLPGRAYYVPNQVCPNCRDDLHERCYGQWYSTGDDRGYGSTTSQVIYQPESEFNVWKCICATNDHKGAP